MKYFIILLILVGFTTPAFASHDETIQPTPTLPQIPQDKCDLYKDLERYDELLHQDMIVKTFFEKYPDAILNSPITIDQSIPPKADINYKYEKEDVKIQLQVYVREVGPNSFDCFVPLYYTYQHQDGDEILNVEFYYNQQKEAIETLNGLSIVSPYEQLRHGINSDDVKCRLGFQKITKHDDSPACVSSQTKETLIHRGWAKGEVSFAGKILDELRKGPQEVNSEQVTFITGLVTLNDTVSDFLKGRNWDSTCCVFITEESSNRTKYSVGINFIDSENQKQLLAVFDLDTLLVTNISIGNMTFHQLSSLEAK